MSPVSQSYSEHIKTFPSGIPTVTTTFPAFQKGSQYILLGIFRN